MSTDVVHLVAGSLALGILVGAAGIVLAYEFLTDAFRGGRDK